MEAVKTYLLSVTAAAVICGIVKALLGDKGTLGAVGKLLTGIFLAMTVIRPLVSLELEDLSDFWEDISLDASAAVTEGENASAQALRERIKTETESYILDKAASFAVQLTVEVTLSDEDIPVPSAVRLTGNVSPYAKLQLQQTISEDLGIPEEAQTWIG